MRSIHLFSGCIYELAWMDWVWCMRGWRGDRGDVGENRMGETFREEWGTLKAGNDECVVRCPKVIHVQRWSAAEWLNFYSLFMFEGVSVLFYYYFLEFFCISSSREETIPWVFFIPHSVLCWRHVVFQPHFNWSFHQSLFWHFRHLMQNIVLKNQIIMCLISSTCINLVLLERSLVRQQPC